MLFAKIMGRQSEDALALINSALALRFQGPDVTAMKAVAQANKNQSLADFSKCAQRFEKEMYSDLLIRRHFEDLMNNLIEDNLNKIILPYSEVQIDFVADKIGLPLDQVLHKLSEMILDEKIKGTLDQGRNCLILYEAEEDCEMFETSISTFTNLDEVIDALYDKTKKFKQQLVATKEEKKEEDKSKAK